LLDLVQLRAAKVAEELAVPHLNPQPLLTQRLRHYYDHDHYTPAGAAVIARAVAAAFFSPAAAEVQTPDRDVVATTNPA